MNFSFNSEQLMLASSVRQCFDRLPRHEAGVVASEGEDVGQALSRMAAEFGELGIFGILAPEEAGGLGMGFADAILLGLEAGRALLPYPAIEQIVAAFYLSRIDPDAATALIEGEAIATAAGSGQLIATAEGDTIHLSGTVLAPYARHARWLLVGARHRDGGGNFAALIDLGVNPASIESAPPFDLTQSLDQVALDHVVTATFPSDARAVLALLASAEIVGLAEHMEARTIQSMMDRAQFGQPIGAFQALKHIAATNKLWLENARVAVEYAAASFDQYRADRAAGREGDHSALERAVAIAKSCASRAARTIARDAIQLHGAMGFSWELGLHVPVRRLVRLSTTYGSAADHNEHLLELVPVPVPPYSFAQSKD